MKWLLSVAWTVFVLGGLGAGWASLHNFSLMTQRVAPRQAVAAASATITPEPMAAHAPLRDFDQDAPPFAPAGEPQAQPSPQPNSPAGRLTVLLMGIDQRP